ncbi:MAG: cupin domain-containing protein [Pseudomonadales bacterium]|nr:cupin domain-containing protein [Pseudomonadales bacterium]MBO6565420.1 cupin domain-containing protein [Pseudomonadales bacterium]MBO6595324.1 cupin domain-containing protein [Pseudomonadales bacterium]MBO6821117.1 cupin domain-containing protein [Pseudomonadales bacterium]
MNGDMGKSVFMLNEKLDWVSSPASLVSRKRFHLVGEPESGQVTSHVRYHPGARFPEHEHPEGEEILVLSGVFSDQAGDWPAGTYLLNPEGFAHAPFSEEGCELFVKLRQYSGSEHHAIDTAEIPIQDLGGYHVRSLFHNDLEQVSLVEVVCEYQDGNATGMEGFLLQGQVAVNGQTLGRHDWFRIAAREPVHITGQGKLYLKVGALSRLKNDAGNAL